MLRLRHTEPTPPRAWLRTSRAALALARETRALLLQSTIMHRDLAPTRIDQIRDDRAVVIVLHGLFATAGALGPLRRCIEANGFTTASFSYEPGCDLRTLVERLRCFVRRIPARCTSIHLVGHSMGGIAARYFVQVGEGDPRVRTTTSLASPFRGTRIAHFVPAFVAHDLLPGSPILARLERHHDRAAHVPHTSIVSTHDQLVLPWHSAIYPHGKRVIVTARGHNTLLFDSPTAAHVVRSLFANTKRPDLPPSIALPKPLPLAS